MTNKEYTICATCTFGLESVLKREITHLDYEITEVEDGKVYIKGSAYDALRLNVNLRCADRVLIECGRGSARDFDELFEVCENIAWEIFLPVNARFDIAKATIVKSEINSVPNTQKIVKKAIVERLKKAYRTLVISESGPTYRIMLRIKNNEAVFYLNTSGEGLNRRGYRVHAGEAPIKETLAAGMVMLSGFNSKRQFADVMCGSGTFVIEAAMYAARMAPGLTRSFDMEKWSICAKDYRKDINEEGYSKIITPEIRLLGSDIDPYMVNAATQNANLAGVGSYCAFQKADLSEFKTRKKSGVMIVNPPYGQRLADRRLAGELCAKLGILYSSLEQWQLVVITSAESFEDDFGKKADRNRKVFNGNIKSYIYFYGR